MGIGGIKIETLAKKVDINKPSFYHYLTDLDYKPE
jgi:AcrR family transcriptional regulator